MKCFLILLYTDSKMHLRSQEMQDQLLRVQAILKYGASRYSKAVNSIFFIIALLVLSVVTSYAQKAGKLTGKISDASTNEPISGASITVKDKKTGTTSITNGTYIFSLEPGMYTIRFTMSGYKTKEITEVVVKADETAFLDIVLEVATKQLGDVVVTATAKKESQASVYAIQRRSAAASDGISLEAINRTPDNNSGQILRRVTGVNMQDNKFVVVRGLSEQYNQTVLNGVPMTSTEGNKNAFAFDIIPAAAIDNIVVNKTATPDMPGSFAGGVVQINTKDFPAKDFLSLSLQTGLSDQTYGKDFLGDERAKFQWLGFDGGIRDLPKGFPGINNRVLLTNMNFAEQVRIVSQLPNNLVPLNNGASGLNEQVQIGFGRNIQLKNKTQFGFVASLNQRKTELIEQDINIRNPLPLFGEEFFLFPEAKALVTVNGTNPRPVVGNYSENIRYKYNVDLGGVLNLAYRFGTNKISLKNLFTQVYNNQFVNRPYIFLDRDFTQPEANYLRVGLLYTNTTKHIINSTLAGEHRAGSNNDIRIDWNVTTTFNNSKQPDTRNFIFAVDSAQKFALSTVVTGELPNTFAEASRIWSRLNDFVLSSGSNISIPFSFFTSKQLFKTGFFVQTRNRSNTVTLLPFQKTYSSSGVGGVLAPQNLINGNTVLNAGVLDNAQRGANYNAGSSLLAVYESMENKIGKQLRVIWGIRMEKYQQNAGSYFAAYFGGFRQYEPVPYTIAARTEFNFLPSINMIYSPASSVNIRAAYSNTVIRPDLRDIIEFPYFDVTNLRVSFGNQELKTTRITNYDFKFEWFPSAGEIISAAVFQKNINDPIQYLRPTNPNVSPLISGVPVNTGRAFVRGVELELRKKMDFIQSMTWLKNVSVFGNTTFLQSKVYEQELQSSVVPKVFEHRLTGQPNFIINTGINIQAFKNSFECTVTFNRSGDYVGELGTMLMMPSQAKAGFVRRETYDFYVRARNLLDAVVSKSFYKNKAKIKLNVVNILREPFILYQDLNNNKKFDEPLSVRGGQMVRGGVPVDKNVPGSYISGIDNTATRLTGQRTYELTFSYTF